MDEYSPQYGARGRVGAIEVPRARPRDATHVRARREIVSNARDGDVVDVRAGRPDRGRARRRHGGESRDRIGVLSTTLLAKGNVVEAACRAPSEELRALEGESDGALIISALDVSDEGSIEAWAKGLKARGVERLDVVINNAGVVGSNGYEAWDLETTTQEEMVYVFKVNTCGPVLVTKALVKEGLLGAAAGGPSLVGNVTSKVGSVDDNGSGRGYSYRASKSALNNCNKSMSIDLADRDVHFALLHPGWVRTNMTEGRGLIDAEESAAGLIAVMEGTFGDCEQNWFDYKGDAIPW